MKRRVAALAVLAVLLLLLPGFAGPYALSVATLILFQSACEEERLSAELASQLATLLQRERRTK